MQLARNATPDHLPQQDLRTVDMPEFPEWLSTLTLSDKGLFLTSILEKPKLFISCVNSANDEDLLRTNQISAVFSLAPRQDEEVQYLQPYHSGLTQFQTTAVDSVYSRLNITRYLCRLTDDELNSDQQVLTAFEAFEDFCRLHSGQPILIHCVLGASRSVSFVAALIAKSENWSFKQAVLEISRHREVGIDLGFARHLTRCLEIRFD